MSKKKEYTVNVFRYNYDIEYMYDIINKRGFTITEPAIFTNDESKQKAMFGSRSPLYGTSYDDEKSFIERYRCECGEFKGAMFEGEICPKCGKPVEFKDTDIEFTGWISLGDNYIVNPYYYKLLCNTIGKNTVNEIIYPRNIVDINGNIHRATAEELGEEKHKHPYVGLGVIDFRKRFVEVMRYFQSQKKKKYDIIEGLIKERGAVFTSHIPIYSTMLRPQSASSDTYYYNSIDKHINPLFSLSERVKDCAEIDKYVILSRIQWHANKLWKLNFELINSKEGWIRGEMLGGSLNFTSRNVIVPDPTLKDNQIDLSYHTFLNLYKFKIIYYLMKTDDISLAKANNIWMRATAFDRKVYEIMLYIIQKEKPKLLINRNPTLNYYSMLLMNVRTVKYDKTDYTLSVPLSILPGLNADFDGDILNIIAMTLKELEHAFRKFDPVERMIISRDTGELNDYFTITKGQLIDLYYFATV